MARCVFSGVLQAALRNFARSWTINTKAHDFRVSVLSSGPIKTPGLLGVAPDTEQTAFLDQFATAVPLGRIGDPDEIAAAATFLASDAAT